MSDPCAYKVSLVACARWETQYISEWVSYHKSIGFDHIYLYCNDDCPVELYQEILPFIENNFITFIFYPDKGKQLEMYRDFIRRYIHETEWFMFLDIDEFLYISSEQKIWNFLQKFPDDMDALYVNWCNYGYNGYKKRPMGSVLLKYTRREIGVNPNTKIIYKSKSFPVNEAKIKIDHPLQHDCSFFEKKLIKYNVVNDNMDFYFDDFPHKAWLYLSIYNRRSELLKDCFIAHFCIKSDEDFDLRVQRGLDGDYASEKMWGDKTEKERQEYHSYTNLVEDCRLKEYWRKYIFNSINTKRLCQDNSVILDDNND